MKKVLLSLFVAVAGAGLVVDDADAKRFGGGRSSGMQREMPARQAPQSPPPQQAQPQAPAAVPARAGAGAAAAAAAPRRSWMGPIAGLAAGLGLAALMSHLGFGAEFANFLMMALLAVAAFVARALPAAPLRGRPQPGHRAGRHAVRRRAGWRTRHAARASGRRPVRPGTGSGRVRRRQRCRGLPPSRSRSAPARHGCRPTSTRPASSASPR